MKKFNVYDNSTSPHLLEFSRVCEHLRCLWVLETIVRTESIRYFRYFNSPRVFVPTFQGSTLLFSRVRSTKQAARLGY